MAKAGKRRSGYIIAMLVSLALLIMIYLASVLIKTTVNKSNIELYGPYEVERVVDGDTLTVRIDGEETYLRLIGVDTP